MPGPRLDHYASASASAAAAAPRAVVLVLHGGQERNEGQVRDKHLSWRRMASMARSLVSFADDHDLALSLLQYRLRGWNGPTDPAPVHDARWALTEITQMHPGVPVVLVGHSMGGRTACHVADDPAVVGVVGLAPWLPEGEPVGALVGRHLRVLHGTRDNWTSARWSRDFVERSRPFAASATWTSMPGAGHFMFRRPSAWRQFVEDSVSDILDHASSHEGASNKGSA